MKIEVEAEVFTQTAKAMIDWTLDGFTTFEELLRIENDGTIVYRVHENIGDIHLSVQDMKSIPDFIDVRYIGNGFYEVIMLKK